MAFVIPDSEPAIATGLAAGDLIAALSMYNILQRDRYLFATRRRLLVSVPKYVTLGSTSYQIAADTQVKLLATSNGSAMVGVVATDDCDVQVVTPYGSVTVTTGGPGDAVAELSGLPTGAWFRLTTKVRSNTGSPVTIHGVYIVDKILDESQLP